MVTFLCFATFYLVFCFSFSFCFIYNVYVKRLRVFLLYRVLFKFWYNNNDVVGECGANDTFNDISVVLCRQISKGIYNKR